MGWGWPYELSISPDLPVMIETFTTALFSVEVVISLLNLSVHFSQSINASNILNKQGAVRIML
jgi:hypothetical protein